MTKFVLTLPDDLAKRARDAGLLNSKAIERLLREQLRRRVDEELKEMLKELAAYKAVRDAESEVVADLDVDRAERRAALRLL